MLLLWVFYSSLFLSTEIQIFQYFKEMCQIARNVYVKTGWFFSLLQSLFPFILNITWGEENPAVIIPQLAAPGFSEDAGMLLALSCEECDKLQAGVWAWLQDAAVDSRDMKALPVWARLQAYPTGTRKQLGRKEAPPSSHKDGVRHK